MLLKIEHLSKTYSNGVKAIQDFSLELRSGMIGLLGPNGAGKSTLMRTLATLQLPDSGTIHFNGLDIFEQRHEYRKRLGYLPQDFGVYPKETAFRLLDYLAVLKGISSKKDRQAVIQYVLELTNLMEHRNKRVSTFSGGMKQRFGIAQLLLNDPQMIIVDEPTAGLDPAERSRFLNVLRQISSEYIVLFSTHLVEDVRELCEDMAIVNKGSLRAHLSPSDALKAIEGKIWEVPKSDLSTSGSEVISLSTHFDTTHQEMVRVYADHRPHTAYTSVTPKLADYYFHTLNAA